MVENLTNWQPRLAQMEDCDELEALIAISVEVLQAECYTPEQRRLAMGPIFGVDRQLIADGTYFVVETDGRIVGCGGWSRRKSLFGAGHAASAPGAELRPGQDPARIRAFFVHPDYARRGIGRAILLASEEALLAAGFNHARLAATLVGIPLYASLGYKIVEQTEEPLEGGLTITSTTMEKFFN